MVEISMLGSGSGMNPDLGNTSFLVSEKNEANLLIDCGFRVPQVLSERQIIKNIEHIAITHTHSDHIGGLELLGFFKYFAPKSISGKKPTLYLPSENMKNTLWEHTLRGGMGFSRSGEHKFPYKTKNIETNRPKVLMEEEGLTVHGKNLNKGNDLFGEIYGLIGPGRNLEDYFNIKIGKEHSINGKNIEFFETPHTRGLENYGLKIKTDNAYVFYSGDTIASPGKLDADVIIQDLQFLDFNINPKTKEVNLKSCNNAHTTLREITNPEYMEYIGEKQRSKTYFTHLWTGHKQRNNDPKKCGYAGFLLPGDHLRVKNNDHRLIGR